MRFLFLNILVFLTVFLPAWAKNQQDFKSYLQRLDSVVDNRSTYYEIKRASIARMQILGKKITSEPDRYLHNSQLYDECFTFNGELAMKVAKENQEIAARRQDHQALCEWKIKESFILASTGQFLEAVAAIDHITASSLSHSLQMSYYGQMQYLYSHMNQFTWSADLKEHYLQLTQIYTDSIYAIAQPEDPEFAWYKAWQDLTHNRSEESIGKLKAQVDTLALDNRQDAMLAYILARLYDKVEDRNNYMRYMTASAMADVRSANLDIASLEELSSALYNLGYLDHAYKYINVCMETARMYNNQARMVSVVRVMDSILASFQERDHAQRQRLNWLIIGLIIAVISLLVVIGLDVRHHRRLKRFSSRLQELNMELEQHRSDLDAANSQLTETNAKLQEAMKLQADANVQLSESNAVKEEYISYLFSMCSNYISKIDDFRKNINRKAKVKQWDEVLQMTDKSNVIQEELKEFYHNFDAIFLNLYPDFVQKFNSLLVPEEQIILKKGELLNTDLRIYALVRLGINDSTKIAEFLHCSPQTVYNNRLKIRSRSLVGKDDFVHVVQSL